MAGNKTIPADRNLCYATEETVPPTDWQSETTSLASSAYQGVLENGRRYPSFNGRESHLPSDEQMFEAYEASHIVALTLEPNQENPLFQAPLDKPPKHVLDIGTGKGSWAIYRPRHGPLPSPGNWLPPNCIMEVDDILQPWTWREPFDLVHLRILDASFTPQETDHLYSQCYDHIAPGGWIEQLEISALIECDDDSVPSDNVLYTWGPQLTRAAQKAGRPLGMMQRMGDSIKKAGFTDIRVRDDKWPIGPWPKDKSLKEAGAVNFQHWIAGMEGYSMWLLTRFGHPVPWSKEEVQVYVAKMRKELSNAHFHCYHRARRVWARKPADIDLRSRERS
ncbi:hypothetical protein N7492_000146 [Penicillium capsulatum]|uniref:S-adenosyl-L-methionine-dependent methyltransferase n=1 Tax=Penicillium capsulatum TaxID=69766 RepID=A0A9W9LYQ6_9EURO|nr:hypothetical protein N7492_000146 [Penicillium capsulatum]